MDLKVFIEEWIAAGNNYDTGKYLEKFQEDAVLDDPSVGRKFIGIEGIREYFTSYFIGYKTQTRLTKLTLGDNNAHLEVEFTGNFPEGKIGGMFDFVFRDGKIQSVMADLI